MRSLSLQANRPWETCVVCYKIWRKTYLQMKYTFPAHIYFYIICICSVISTKHLYRFGARVLGWMPLHYRICDCGRPVSFSASHPNLSLLQAASNTRPMTSFVIPYAIQSPPPPQSKKRRTFICWIFHRTRHQF